MCIYIYIYVCIYIYIGQAPWCCRPRFKGEACTDTTDTLRDIYVYIYIHIPGANETMSIGVARLWKCWLRPKVCPKHCFWPWHCESSIDISGVSDWQNEKVQWPAGPTAGFETSNGLAEACGSLGLGPENPLSAPQTKGPTCICKNMQLWRCWSVSLHVSRTGHPGNDLHRGKIICGAVGGRRLGGGAPICTLGPVHLNRLPPGRDSRHSCLLCQQGIESRVTANIFLTGLCPPERRPAPRVAVEALQFRHSIVLCDKKCGYCLPPVRCLWLPPLAPISRLWKGVRQEEGDGLTTRFKSHSSCWLCRHRTIAIKFSLSTTTSVRMHMHHPCTHCTEPPPSSSLSLRDSPRVRRAGATRSRRSVRRQDFRIQFALVLLHPSMFEAAICTAPPFYVI